MVAIVQFTVTGRHHRALRLEMMALFAGIGIADLGR
jgi:hypothetical protein